VLPLLRGLDHVAIGSARHHAILQLAGRAQLAREPDAKGKQHDGDHKSYHRTTAVIASLRFGHRPSAAFCLLPSAAPYIGARTSMASSELEEL
jgi:hypothetical protein